MQLTASGFFVENTEGSCINSTELYYIFENNTTSMGLPFFI